MLHPEWWGSLYGALRRTNEAIYNLHTLGTNLSEADRIRLEAELRLVRGWLYFELVKRYKEIIIYDEDLTAIVKDKAVSPEADGWKAVKDDLAFAEQNLPEKANARGRLDKGAAYALATRALLYAKDYAVCYVCIEEEPYLTVIRSYQDGYNVFYWWSYR